MKTLLVSIALICYVSLGAEAQQRREPISPEKVAERITERMSKELGLSEQQKKEVYAVHLETTQRKREERQRMLEKLKTQRKAKQEKMDAILTPVQKEKWESRKKEFHNERMSPGKNN